MNKKNKIMIFGIAIISGLIISTLLLSAIPLIKEHNIKSEIEKANYCEIDSDCVDAGGKCPFGCMHM